MSCFRMTVLAWDYGLSSPLLPGWPFSTSSKSKFTCEFPKLFPTSFSSLSVIVRKSCMSISFLWNTSVYFSRPNLLRSWLRLGSLTLSNDTLWQWQRPKIPKSSGWQHQISKNLLDEKCANICQAHYHWHLELSAHMDIYSTVRSPFGLSGNILSCQDSLACVIKRSGEKSI